MTHTRDLPEMLKSGYEQLTQVDEALREAEKRLLAAHSQVQLGRVGPRAEVVYQEVLSLRDRSRRVMGDLADVWADEA